MAGDINKTLQPTPKRLRDAREKGQVATSRELSLAAASLAATAVLVVAGSMALDRLARSMGIALSHLGDRPLRNVTPEDLVPMVTSGGMLIGTTVGPIALAAICAAVLATAAQTRFNFTVKTLHINWKSLSPAQGFAKLAPSKSGIDTLKAVLTGTVLSLLAWQITKTLLGEAARLPWTTPVASAAIGWREGVRLLWQTGLALVALGAADFGVQRWRLRSSLKMSHQEVRDEAKQTEVNPEVRGRIRRIQLDMARRRMLKAVPKATVVITNPTHYAVALKYTRAKNVAPVVVAKGQELMAAKIREIARDHLVPIIENPPLARALFKECEIGDVIPGPLFGAVAEILAYLIRIKQLVL
jgi:flagellar biosynthesis protein FlhB